MKIHRFYTPNTTLEHELWMRDERILHQWFRVLRFRPGQEVVLFDGQTQDRLYRIVELKPTEAHLELITEYKRQLPKKTIYLFWALLKKDKNDWVLQKATELGVSHFVPLLADRSEKTGFNHDRAVKIIVEAAEQCGRSDIPTLREPLRIQTALTEFKDAMPLYICEQDSVDTITSSEEAGVLIGPEGGWSDSEKQLFSTERIKHLNLHDFTLRAETACVVASAKLLQ